MQANGFIGRAQYPRGPVQWSLLGTAAPVEVGTTERVLFEFNAGGWDDWGLNADTNGLAAGDTVVIRVTTPAGGEIASQTITGGSVAGPQATTSTAALPALSPRYVVHAVGTYTSLNTAPVNASIFLRRTAQC